MLCWLCDGKTEAFQNLDKDPRMAVYRRLSDSQPQAVMKASEVMNFPVITIENSQTVSAALTLMNEHSLHHLPVLDEEKSLVGLASDRDLLLVSDKSETQVSEVMARRLLTARPDSSLWSVAQTMTASRVNCVVVVNEHKELLGILTSLDLLACMTHHAPVEVWL